MKIDEHVAWLLGAMRQGAARHDSFEIERHFDVAATHAVELGATLHGIAGSPRAVASLDEVVVSNGDTVIEYRNIDGAETRLTVPRSADGRLGMPTFS